MYFILISLAVSPTTPFWNLSDISTSSLRLKPADLHAWCWVPGCLAAWALPDLSVGRRAPSPLPGQGQNFFNFMQFLGTFGKIVCPPPEGWRSPTSGKSWIRHCWG